MHLFSISKLTSALMSVQNIQCLCQASAVTLYVIAANHMPAKLLTDGVQSAPLCAAIRDCCLKGPNILHATCVQLQTSS